MDADTAASFMLSSKPAPGGVPEPVREGHRRTPASSPTPPMPLDPTATATPGAACQDVEDDLPFRYRDTATSRAGLGAARHACSWTSASPSSASAAPAATFSTRSRRPPSTSILLFDGDFFDNHNAFRAPGAPTLEELRRRPYKVDYFADMYGRHAHRHHRRQAHHRRELVLLDDATFVFLAWTTQP